MPSETQHCDHIITQMRDGQQGSWCVDCGAKVFDVEDRECQGCAHARNTGSDILPWWICKRHLMSITANMHVTFKISEGTCWEDSHAE